MPIISPSATNPNITGLDDGNLVWRTAASDNLQAKVLGTLPPSTAKVDIIYVNDSATPTASRTRSSASFPGTVTRQVGFPAATRPA